jgi:hypothetical protein
MEYPIENEKLENVERILRDRYDSSVRLDGIECNAGSRQGDNYMSIIKRIFVHGKWKADDRGEPEHKRKVFHDHGLENIRKIIE